MNFPDLTKLSAQEVTFWCACLTVIITVSYNASAKIFDVYWNRNTKELTEILDVYNKSDHKSEKLKELLEFHQAKFYIQKEQLLDQKRKRYQSRSGNIIGAVKYYGWKIILILPYLFFISAAFWAAYYAPAFDWMKFITTSVLFTLNLALPLRIYDFITRRFFQSSWTEFIWRLTNVSEEVKHYKATFKQKEKEIVKALKITTLIENGTHIVYDYIGFPEKNHILIFKKTTNKRLPLNQEVIYEFEQCRETTMLEVEWATRLNRTGGVIRRTSPYIPYLVQSERDDIPSAYYLIIK